jgi:hypothetical protein
MRDDIVQRLRVWGDGYSGNNPDCEKDCDDAANEIVRLREERRWIPVTERWPEEDSVVLAFLPEGSQLKPEVREMYFSDGEWINDRGHWEVTHWMPLPATPRDDK